MQKCLSVIFMFATFALDIFETKSQVMVYLVVDGFICDLKLDIDGLNERKITSKC